MTAAETVRPASEAEVAEVLRAARADGRMVRVSGGGVSALPPRDGAIGLSMSAVRGIVELRPADGVVTVLAGTPLRELTAALRAARRRLPLRPWDPDGRATIGGAVAAGADGLTAREGFRWRDHVLGARAALPSGEVVRVGASVVKSVAGFDVCKALVGSHGTIAVILCLDLRIEAVPGVSAAFRSPGVPEKDVARLVAASDAPASPPRGIVVTPTSLPDAATVDVLLEGSERAVAAGESALRRGKGRLERVPDPEAHWAALTALAASPAPPGMVRRVGPAARTALVPWTGSRRSCDWVADALRSRITWLDAGPAPTPDTASARLFGRLRAAFDPESGLQPGRGFGHP